MKLLCLTCSTGEGHNSAARALAEAAEALGHRAVLADPIAFGAIRTDRAAAELYNWMVQKTPRTFGRIYHLGALYDASRAPSPVYFFNALHARRLADYIEAEAFDAVIATHLYGMECMTAARRRGLVRVPCWGVMTDYTLIPFMRETDLDGWIIPHEDLRDDMAARGMPSERLFSLGIPVSRRFRSELTRKEARLALELPEEKCIYLLMTGGAGGCDLLGLSAALLEREENEDTVLCLIAGKNAELCRSLQKAYADEARVRVYGYTRQIPTFMRACNVLLTKPGGLSSTEAAAANVPLVHVSPIPGCENANAAFFAQRGMSVAAEDPLQAAAAAMALARDRERAERMRSAQRENIDPEAAEKIVEKVLGA